jgi:hypothetical protein
MSLPTKNQENRQKLPSSFQNPTTAFEFEKNRWQFH